MNKEKRQIVKTFVEITGGTILIKREFVSILQKYNILLEKYKIYKNEVLLLFKT